MNIVSTELMPMDSVHFLECILTLQSFLHLKCKLRKITVIQLPWVKFVRLKKNELIGSLRDKTDPGFNHISHFSDVKTYFRDT